MRQPDFIILGDIRIRLSDIVCYGIETDYGNNDDDDDNYDYDDDEDYDDDDDDDYDYYDDDDDDDACDYLFVEYKVDGQRSNGRVVFYENEFDIYEKLKELDNYLI